MNAITLALADDPTTAVTAPLTHHAKFSAAVRQLVAGRDLDRDAVDEHARALWTELRAGTEGTAPPAPAQLAALDYLGAVIR